MSTLLNMNWDSDVGRLLVAMAFGMLIGIERELNEKPAGLKTNVLICLGSALFTVCSIKIWGSVPDFHIPAQIVTGIGFLGAGAILREGEHVTGLTTAATIWIDAAIGMCVGMGYYTLAGVATLATLAVQTGLNRLDLFVDKLRQKQLYRIVSEPSDQSIEEVARVMRSHRIKVLNRKVMKRDNLYHSEWFTFGNPVAQEKVIFDLLKSGHVIEVTY